MRILITGGAGFIGSELAKTLQNHEVVTFDMANADIEGDVLDKDSLIEAAQDCDVVFHLAAFLGVKNTEENPLKTLDINIMGVRNALDACVKNGVKKIVFSSSSEVYGNPERTPISETDRLAPVSVYGYTKVVGENYVKAYSAKHGLKYSIVRYFNVYGPRQRLDFVLPKMVHKAVRSEPLEIYGSGEQVRAFTHVKDAVNGTILAMEKGHNDTFNIGNDSEPVSINELAARIIKITGSGSRILHIPLAKSDRSEAREIFKRVPSIIKARKELGYMPAKTLDEGISDIADSYEDLQ